ncbi:ZNF608 [Cordylochernes scorpioides]|uniref:ZNF608 n=1 Tax=Cordylochernes scorpioides TaxID=51811 RepID=A0ABY6KQX3_9ARAC|nr:ZNF608 [Cordylochernes scorpioides]
MKDHSLDGHRGRVAPEVGGTTNFDDDYNEWELGIGDLIIDLDADIEKTNVEQQASPMSKRAVEHQATVDKGLKMKIKRKNVGGKTSETKHEIVQSDTTKICLLAESTSAPTTPPSLPPPTTDKSSKHSSGKGRSGSHREKKEKNREKTSTASASKPPPPPAPPVVNTSSSSGAASPTVPEVNGVSPPPALKISPPTTSVPSPGPPAPTDMPNLTLRLSEEPSSPASPPAKRIKLEKVDAACSPLPLEVKDMGTDTSSVGTITEPDCLGPCEPGTSVTLEGIVWQETQGGKKPSYLFLLMYSMLAVHVVLVADESLLCSGVLVVNVTWRGKTYVGTLLDCTKHDWAPPRFCESPTSDVDSKNAKGGRGKRGRTNNANENFTENNRTPVQSKLRNGKGRRGFTVPSSPAKAETTSNSSSSNKRKGGSKPNESTEPPAPETTKSSSSSSSSSSGGSSNSGKRARSQSRGPAASTAPPVTTTTTTTTTTTCSSTPSPAAPTPPDDQAPASPVFIECPEPNCSKKYKHINGLKYHQTHAHSGNPPGAEIKMEEGEEGVSKEPSELEEAIPHSPSLPSDWVPTQENDSLSTLASVAISDSAKPRTFPTQVVDQDIPTSDPSSPLSQTPPNIFSQAAASPRCPLLTHHIDKVKIKQEKPDKSPKTSSSNKPPYLSGPIRPIVPALPPPASQALKPIQPKPTILGEPPNIALESLKREKSKHRKKNKDRKSSEKSPTSSIAQTSSSVSEDKMDTTGGSYLGSDIIPNLNDGPQPLPLESSPTLELGPPPPVGNNSLLGDVITDQSVQSPAYSDISDANEPPATLDTDDKDKGDKKTTELTPSQTSALTTFGMYSYYGQPPYLIPSVAASTTADKGEKPLESSSSSSSSSANSSKNWNEMEASAIKKSSQEEQSGNSSSARDYHYPFPYSYVQGFPYSVDAPYHLHQYDQYMDDPERMFKERHSSGKGGDKDEKSANKERQNIDKVNHPHLDPSCKQAVSVIKEPEGLLSQGKSSKIGGIVSREKQLENHQIIKENMELKSQMGGSKMKHYDMSRLLDSRPEDLKRFYVLHSVEQDGGKGDGSKSTDHRTSPPKLDHPKNYSSSASTSSLKGGSLKEHHHHHKKDPPPIVKSEEREDRKSERTSKSEGQKPTMETTGPPPPPTNSYAYLPPSYLQSPPSHFAHMPFDHGAHPMYRNMMMSPSHHAFSGSPFIHPTLRYHPAAEQTPPAVAGDSKLHPGGPTKALDLLHQVSQHYTSSNHKIHELQEHAIAGGPSSNGPSTKGSSSSVVPSPSATDSSGPAPPTKQESRSSPPPQRHLHTHHHTHVGVTYPLYDPYGGRLTPHVCMQQF